MCRKCTSLRKNLWLLAVAVRFSILLGVGLGSGDDEPLEIIVKIYNKVLLYVDNQNVI